MKKALVFVLVLIGLVSQPNVQAWVCGGCYDGAVSTCAWAPATAPATCNNVAVTASLFDVAGDPWAILISNAGIGRTCYTIRKQSICTRFYVYNCNGSQDFFNGFTTFHNDYTLNDEECYLSNLLKEIGTNLLACLAWVK